MSAFFHIELILDLELFWHYDASRAKSKPKCIFLAYIEMLADDHGTRAHAHLHSLRNEKDAAMLNQIISFAVHRIADLRSLQAGHDFLNNASKNEAPFVMPSEIVNIRNAVFISSVLTSRRDRIASFMSV